MAQRKLAMLVLFLVIQIYTPEANKINEKKSSDLKKKKKQVAQHKLAMSVFVVPAVVALGAVVLSKGPLGLRAGLSCLMSPAWLWLTVRWLEDGVACLNACVELSTLLTRKGEVRMGSSRGGDRGVHSETFFCVAASRACQKGPRVWSVLFFSARISGGAPHVLGYMCINPYAWYPG